MADDCDADRCLLAAGKELDQLRARLRVRLLHALFSTATGRPTIHVLTGHGRPLRFDHPAVLMLLGWLGGRNGVLLAARGLLLWIEQGRVAPLVWRRNPAGWLDPDAGQQQPVRPLQPWIDLARALPADGWHADLYDSMPEPGSAHRRLALARLYHDAGLDPATARSTLGLITPFPTLPHAIYRCRQRALVIARSLDGLPPRPILALDLAAAASAR